AHAARHARVGACTAEGPRCPAGRRGCRPRGAPAATGNDLRAIPPRAPARLARARRGDRAGAGARVRPAPRGQGLGRGSPPGPRRLVPSPPARPELRQRRPLIPQWQRVAAARPGAGPARRRGAVDPAADSGSPHPCRTYGVAQPAQRAVSTAVGCPSLIRMRPLVEVQPGPPPAFTSGNDDRRVRSWLGGPCGGSRPLTWLPALVMGQAISSARSLPLRTGPRAGGRSNRPVAVGAAAEGTTSRGPSLPGARRAAGDRSPWPSARWAGGLQ